MDVINRTTLEFRPSANEPDYPEPAWQHNPDMLAVAGIPRHHQKWDVPSDSPVPMTTAEMAAVDAALLADQVAAIVGPISGANALDLIRSVALVMRDEINVARAAENTTRASVVARHSQEAGNLPQLSMRTIPQLITAIEGYLT